MKKRALGSKKNAKSKHQPISWLPIDNRFFPFIHLGEVKGIARVFLKLEITISIVVVFLTIIAAILKIFLIVIRMF